MNQNDQSFMANKIRTQYMEKQSTDLDALRELDRRAKRPASLFAYVLGSLGAIVMGAGMSLVMTEIGVAVGVGAALPIGIAVGVVGLALVCANYPLYKWHLKTRKEKYAAEVLALSEKILNENQ